MKTFRETFELAESRVRPLLTEYGFTLSDLSVTGKPRSNMIAGVAFYKENRRWLRMPRNRRFIRLSVAPFRLEWHLDIGLGNEWYSIYELHELEGDSDFPGLPYGLYESTYDEDKLQAVFECVIGVLIRCGRRFIENDLSLWPDLRNQRKRLAVLRANEQIARNAEVAFKAQRWNEVLNLLEGREDTLSELNKRRLSYAKKKLRLGT